MRRPPDRFGPGAITATYVVLGALWILLSDRALFAVLGRNHELVHAVGTAKGWAFVLGSGLLIYALITRREHATTRQARVLSTILGSTGDLVLVCDHSGAVIAANPAAERVWGQPRTQDDLDGWHAADGEPELPTRDRPMTRALRGDVVEGVYLVRNVRVPGGRWFRVTGRPVAGAEVAGAVLACDDVTEARKVEADLRASQALFETLARLAPVAISRTDPHGVPTYRNAAWAAIAGWPTEDGVGAGWSNRLHPEDRDAVMSEWQRVVREAGSFRKEYRYVRPDGAEVWVWAQAEAERDAEGRVLGYVGTLTDITDRRRAEDAMRSFTAVLEARVRERTAELEATTRELTAFSSSVSHDLRAPLRTIAGFTSAVLEDHGEGLPGEARANLHRVVAASKRMGEIIDSLLGLSRVTRSELARTRVDVSALARSIVAELREREPSRVIEVEIADGVSAWGDPGLLAIVVENLLSNAWKFTVHRERARIEVGGGPGVSESTVSIRDNGAGFEMAWSRKLWQPFERLHTVREFPGSGIGLATVHRIVTRHGGRVWAEGRVGEGATFGFALPEPVDGASAER